MSTCHGYSSISARSAVSALTLFSLLVTHFQQSRGNDASAPIIDVRFDAPYRQIQSSLGDEWAPTWGRDNNLYTANDDGSSFGGVPNNAFAFGKLVGSDPYNLKGVTINGMQHFREQPEPGPEGASWKRLESYKVNGVLYRFVPCGLKPGWSVYSCLTTSDDAGKSWTPVGGREQPMFSGTTFKSPFFISYRKEYEEGFGGNSGAYIYAASYTGLVDNEDSYIIGRIPKEKLPNNSAADWSFKKHDASWGGLDNAIPTSNDTGRGPDSANWKAMNSYSVGGVLYMFITRCHYPAQAGDSEHRHIFRDASIIKSTDQGQTWVRPAAQNYSNPMFPGGRFGTPYFVWYGQDGSAVVDNADRYVYAVSNDGHFEGGDNYVLGRVSKEKLSQLSAADWSFFRTGNGMQDKSWTAKLEEAMPILMNAGRSSMTGMTYIEGLGRYVMVVWHYSQVSFETAILKRDLSTVLEFFEAPKPWGPWSKVKSFNTGRLGWYAPIIGQRFQTSSGSTAVRAFMYTTGFTSKPEGGLDSHLYKLDYMPITLSTRLLPDSDSAFVAGR